MKFPIVLTVLLTVFKAAAQPPPTNTLPGMIALCEDSDGCADIVFKGAQGKGTWADGSVGGFTIQSVTATGVSLLRVDLDGTTRGLTALYTGRRMGDWVEGTYVANSLLGPATGAATVAPQTSNWHALILPSTAMLEAAKFGTSYRAQLSHGAPANATAWKVCVDFGNACEGASPAATELWTLVETNAKGTMGHRQDAQEGAATSPLFDHTLFVDRFDATSFLMRSLDTRGRYKGVARLFSGTRDGDAMRGKVTLIAPGKNSKPFTRNWVAMRVSVPTCERPDDAQAGVETLKLAVRFNSMLLDEAAAQRCGLMVAGRGAR